MLWKVGRIMGDFDSQKAIVYRLNLGLHSMHNRNIVSSDTEIMSFNCILFLYKCHHHIFVEARELAHKPICIVLYINKPDRMCFHFIYDGSTLITQSLLVFFGFIDEVLEVTTWCMKEWSHVTLQWKGLFTNVIDGSINILTSQLETFLQTLKNTLKKKKHKQNLKTICQLSRVKNV